MSASNCSSDAWPDSLRYRDAVKMTLRRSLQSLAGVGTEQTSNECSMNIGTVHPLMSSANFVPSTRKMCLSVRKRIKAIPSAWRCRANQLICDCSSWWLPERFSTAVVARAGSLGAFNSIQMSSPARHPFTSGAPLVIAFSIRSRRSLGCCIFSLMDCQKRASGFTSVA